MGSYFSICYSSEQIQPLHLNSIMINKLLHTGTVTEHLNIESKKYCLQLQSNTKCFLVSVENQPFFILEKFYNQNISLLESEINVTNYININLVKQHLLHYRVVTEDIGCFILADIVCGCWSFILAEIVM